jgi:hypothetical protein
MTSRFLVAGLLFAGAALLAAAQEPKQDPPKGDKEKPKVVKAPDGWRFVKPKDQSYAVLFPRDVDGQEQTERSFKQNGFIGKSQINSCTLKDGRELIVIGTTLSGPATKDLKINDVYDLFYDLDKEPGAKLSEPKEVPVGVRKGREHYVTKKTEVERNVVVVVRGRVYQLVVIAKTKEATQDKTADTFLTSLILYAPKKDDKGKDAEKKDKAKAPPPR